MTGIFYDTEDYVLNRQEMIDELRKRECRVIFKKVNGDERDMKCTLMESAIPEFAKDGNTDEKSIAYSDEVIRVVDTASGEWRSFKVANVISFT